MIATCHECGSEPDNPRWAKVRGHDHERPVFKCAGCGLTWTLVVEDVPDTPIGPPPPSRPAYEALEH